MSEAGTVHNAGSAYTHDRRALSALGASRELEAPLLAPPAPKKVVPDPISLASINCCVTVYGYTPANLSLIMHGLLDYGQIESAHFDPDPHSNLFHVRFSDSLSAQAAVAARRIQLSRRSIVGVTACMRPEKELELRPAEPLPLSAFALTSPRPPTIRTTIFERVVNWLSSLL
ncbi:Nup53/35/40-type RNA recognition motif-containing protein [Giardia muris]|uniref:Nup53/35/40-type RNA recognition motif-containing protein n=1 Tax=Giardia muris TaxID=5742 RepID=A0A4Z1SRH3_GIAMU|nr:Nup53/35/40-type RNA recognition motif-containing protein [Giardia muris]|eukprot:TNJ27575.1 Nup53/35/40-type RNA recognition motif-containing protein [Giardia muris]